MIDDFNIHPTYKQQVQETHKSKHYITFNNICQYINDILSLTLKSMTKLDTSGVINSIYLIEAESSANTLHKYILRVSNSHKMWRSFKTQHEVTVLSHIKTHTKIPVPEVIDYCANAQESRLKCEYILMEYIEHHSDMDEYRETLVNKLRNCAPTDKQVVLDQVKNQLRNLLEQGYQILVQMTKVRFSTHLVCGYGLKMDEPARVSWDGPSVGPCKSMQQFLLECMDVHIKNLKHSEQVSKQIADQIESVMPGLEKFRSELQSEDIFRILSLGKEFGLVHRDLHAGNLLVDSQGKIVAVLDWEHSRNGWLQEAHDQTDLVQRWISCLQCPEIQEPLKNYQEDVLRIKHNLSVDSSWEHYRKYFEINERIGWSWFFVVSWWGDAKQLQGIQYMKEGSLRQLQQLRNLLQKYGYL